MSKFAGSGPYIDVNISARGGWSCDYGTYMMTMGTVC